jgi:hypothetical protein
MAKEDSSDDDLIEDPEYAPGMSDDNSLDPSEFERDEHFADEGDVNFDLVPQHQQHSRRFTKRDRLIVCAILLGLAVALGVFFSGGNKKSESSSTSNPTFTLEEPPEDLSTTCSLQALADDGKEACLQDCEKAECCDFPANLPLSCLEGNQQKCLVYHTSCSNLEADSYDKASIPSSVPPAPSNLAELCTSASIKTVDGFTACHEACKHAECCYEEGMGTCSHEECAGYAPCLTLAATDHVHQDIPVVVEQVCATDKLATMDGRTACRQACSHALCCFSSDVSQETSCPHQDTSFCSQYTKCNELESVTPVDATPQEIALTCQDTENVEGHISLCELVCQQGACCFSDVECDEVAPGIQCSDYEPCRKVFIGDDGSNVEAVKPPTGTEDEQGDDDQTNQDTPSTGGQIDWDPNSVNKASIDASCETNRVVEVVAPPDQLSLCEQVCMPGACCFDKDVVCDVPDPERFCTTYSACSKLHPDEEAENENPPIDDDALKEACQKDDLEECENMCQQGICCFEGDVCDVPHPERFCAHFGYCDVLDEDDDFVNDDDAAADDDFVDDDAVNDDAVNDDAVDKNDEDIKKILGIGVNDGDMEDESWVDQVEESGNTEEPGNQDTEIVEVVDSDGTIINGDAIAEACNSNEAKCETLCKQGECCYKEGCAVEHPEVYCAAFAPCDKYYAAEDEGDKDGDGEDEEEDESWIDEIGSDQEGEEDEDSQIIEIVDVNGQVVGEDVLHKACTTGSVKCETLCKQGACCFEGTCDVADPERFCLAFGVCEKYYVGA